MTPERFQLIDELFHLALQQPPAERPGFITETCAGDKTLCEEVTSMIEAHERSDDLLNKPASEILALDLVSELTEPSIGQTIGHYKVLELISLGMGNVYLAQDTSLLKKVALKVLPLHFSQDEERVRRFEQEARLASATDHQNICVIHEINQTDDGRHFIAMEYIAGPTLRERMLKAPVRIDDVLHVGVQVAAALEAAHEQGIVHRDIKPENIMLRRDGFVKVLDFGIAKLNEDIPLRQSIEEPLVGVRTEHGRRMGTVKYMSPEQLELPVGEPPVDGRSDIWSLGVVLHEMVTGITPFEAPSSEEIIDLILDKDPPQLSFSADVPTEFQQIVEKTLRKREKRYQKVTDLACDLRRLRRQIELAELPPPIPSPPIEPGSLVKKIIEYIFGAVREHKTIAILATVTTISLIFIAFKFLTGADSAESPNSEQPIPAYQTMKISRLTNSDASVCAAISPNGTSIAHAEEKNGMQQLLLTDAETSASSVVVPAGKVQYKGITFSNNGNFLYFIRTETSEIGTLYEVALPHGVPRRIMDGVDGPISFSPNGDRFSFINLNRQLNEYSLVIADIDGNGQRTITRRVGGNRLALDGVSWSPDGKTVVCAAGWWEKGYRMKLLEIDVETGEEKTIGDHSWFSVLQLAWLNDKSGLIISAAEQAMSPYQLWLISYPAGRRWKITNELAEYKGISLSKYDGKLVSVRSEQVSAIWVAPSDNLANPKVIVSKVGLSNGLSWGSNNRIVLSSMIGNNLNISTVNPDGSDQKQLTFNEGDNYTPAVSPDGRHIVFASNRNGAFNIWQMNAADGGQPRQLTFSDGNFYPFCSPDNHWVYFDNQNRENTTVWKVSSEGGDAVRITDSYARMPAVSPDNRFIAARYYTRDNIIGIAIIALEDRSIVRFVPIPVMQYQKLEWISDGQALSYVQNTNGASNVWSYDLKSDSSRRLTDFKTDRIFSYAWSPDRTQLACERGKEIRQAAMITDYR